MEFTKGLFISVEGGEGGGKSSAIKTMKEFFEKQGRTVVTTREPGGVDSAEKIRKLLLDNRFTPTSEVYLFGAARYEHLHHVIKPALEKGHVVICDRFYDSTIVYQGHVGNLGMDNMYEFNSNLVDGIHPQHTLYFDVDVEVGLNRIFSNSNREVSEYDKRDISYHEKVREGYLLLMEKPYGKDRIIKIDANKSIEEVHKELQSVLKSIL